MSDASAAAVVSPLATWDASDPSWMDEHWRERTDWAAAHFPDVNRTVRAEFYLVDVPFAVLHRFAKNEDGQLFLDPATGNPAWDDPVRLMLAELPPGHLMRRP